MKAHHDAGCAYGRKKCSANVAVLVLAALIFTSAAVPALAAKSDERPRVTSGETQVIARIGKREFTVSELRVELMRLGVGQSSPEIERFALESLINRHLLAEAAVSAGFDRKAEAILRVEAAKAEALADYYIATVSQPTEPALSEIEDFIAANPSLFDARKRYDFSTLALPTAAFDEEAMGPLFSETDDFSTLVAFLEAQGIAFEQGTVTRNSSGFPREIRAQLARFDVSDNIVIKAGASTEIMKIDRIKNIPLPLDQRRSLARRLLLKQASVKRSKAALDALKTGKRVVYYRKELAPTDIRTDAPTKTPGRRQTKPSGT